jgi:hypothetical protein
VQTIGEPTLDEFEDLFTDATNVYSSSDTAIAGGEAMLAGAPGTYSSNGSLFSVPVVPGAFESWNTASMDGRVPTDTSLLMRVYDTTGSTTPTLISDADLPGNSAGFVPGAIDLSSLDAGTYQSLSLGAAFSSSDAATTSALLQWSLSYTLSRPAIPDVPFTLTSNKLIGTNASGTPLYKYQDSFVTDGSGEELINDIEWDIYEVEVDDAAYDIAEACENIPYALDPGVDETLILTLVAATDHSFRVRVEDSSGTAIPDAELTLSRSGYTETLETSSCGQSFFSGLNTAIDFALEVDATGYVSQTITNIDISGEDSLTVIMVDA